MATVTVQVSHPWPCEFDRSHMSNQVGLGKPGSHDLNFLGINPNGNRTYLATNTKG